MYICDQTFVQLNIDTTDFYYNTQMALEDSCIGGHLTSLLRNYIKGGGGVTLVLADDTSNGEGSFNYE